jgi:hypothetical protein
MGCAHSTPAEKAYEKAIKSERKELLKRISETWATRGYLTMPSNAHESVVATVKQMLEQDGFDVEVTPHVPKTKYDTGYKIQWKVSWSSPRPDTRAEKVLAKGVKAERKYVLKRVSDCRESTCYVTVASDVHENVAIKVKHLLEADGYRVTLEKIAGEQYQWTISWSPPSEDDLSHQWERTA